MVSKTRFCFLTVIHIAAAFEFQSDLPSFFSPSHSRVDTSTINQVRNAVSVKEQQSRLQKMEELVGKQEERVDHLSESLKEQLSQVQDQMLAKMEASQLEEKSQLTTIEKQLQQLDGRMDAFENVSREVHSEKTDETNINKEKPKVKFTTIQDVGLSFALIMEPTKPRKMEKLCAQLVEGGRLIVLDTKLKLDALKTYVANASAKRSFYVGLRKKGDRHLWSNGEELDETFWCNKKSHDNDSSHPEGAQGTYPGIDVAMHSDQSCSWDGISPPLDDETKKQNEVHDLLRVKKPTFLPNYKNPCWFEEDQTTLLCLPYFHLAGFHKCGTTNTFSTIAAHQDVAAPRSKETHWIAGGRFKENSDIVKFATRFSKPAREIESRVLMSSSGQTFHPLITGDGSPSTVCHNVRWRYLPGNYNCTEPRVLNPHYLYHHNPSAKIIILIRNPTDRMISAFNYMTKEYPVVTAESFHEEVVKEIRTLEKCFSVSSVRTCTYDNIMQLQTGLYHVFIRDWMNVFPREQLLIARLEDIRDDPYTSYSEIFDFLDLSPVSRSQYKKMQNIYKNSGRTRFTAWNETRRLLDNFYRPHNIQLAKLLQNRFPTYT
ncbi:carbohydrate sulfotransferase 15-like [Haliotis asinina]|uniref:carbohydrate sulfotransferase 15-like n=1 Tax=Haliotis asinina TaxID=109174 RepID=UPI0035326A0D